MSHEQERAAALVDAVGQHFTVLIDASIASANIKAAIRLATMMVELLSDIHTAEKALAPELQTALNALKDAVEALSSAASFLETRIEASSDGTLASFRGTT